MKTHKRLLTTVIIFAFFIASVALCGLAELQEVDAASDCDHDFVKTDACDATATTCGNFEYWTCSKCGKYFMSPNDSDETYKYSWLIPSENSFGKYDSQDIDFVELIPVNSDPYGLQEEDQGNWAEDGSGNKYFAYSRSAYSFEWGDALRLHLKNGSVVDYIFTPNRQTMDTYFFINADDDTDLIGIWTSSQNGMLDWIPETTARYPGDVFDSQFVYKNHTFTAKTTITPNPIASIDYQTYNNQPLQIEENDPNFGQIETDSDGNSFFFYQNIRYHMGDVLTVNYRDGITKDYTLRMNDECYVGFIADDGEILQGYFDWQSEQLSDHWYVGNTYTCDLMFNRRMVSFGVEIVPASGQSHTVDPDLFGKDEFGYFHDWDTSYTIDTPATCTMPGYQSIHCLRCGSSTQGEEIQPLGHDEEVLPWKDPSCTEPGSTEGRKCVRCGEITEPQNEIPALGHDYVDIEGTAESPDCTTDGKINDQKCSRCGDEISGEVIPALGHDEESIPGIDATCTEPGMSDGAKCRRCGEVTAEPQVIEALGHKWGAWVIVKEPTAEEQGVSTRKCSRCDAAEDKDIPKLIKLAASNISVASVTYTGSTLKPAPVVTVGGVKLKKGTDYKVEGYSNNIKAGTTASVKVTGIGKYTGTVTRNFTINKAEQTVTLKQTKYSKTYLDSAFSLGAQTNGDGAIKYSSDDTGVATVSTAGKVTIKGAGTAKITVYAAAGSNYKKSASKTVTITVAKAANTLNVSGKTATVYYSKLKNEKQTLDTSKVLSFSNKGKGTRTYTISSGNSKITINKTTGKITVNKGLAKGTYTVKVKVKAAGNSDYKAVTKTVTVKIIVK